MTEGAKDQPSTQERLASLKQREKKLSALVQKTKGREWKPRYERLTGLREEIKALQDSIPSAGPVSTVSQASLRASGGGSLYERKKR